MAHGLVSSRMFAGANILYQIFSSRSLFFVKGAMGVAPIMAFIWFFRLRANMGVPPTINLQREIILTRRIIFISFYFILPVALSLFFRAAYSLLLYSSTQHGVIGGLRNVFECITSRALLIMGLHLVPVFLLFLKSGVVMN